MKILYICGTYAPGAFAGSEISAHELLCQLNKDPAVSVLVVTDQKYTDITPEEFEYGGVPIHGISHENRRESINAILDSYKPDVILTQLLWSDEAVSAGRSGNIPTVFRIPSYAPNLDITRPTALVANSRFICEWVKRKSGRECNYIFSTIDLDRVVAPVSNRNPTLITMFNPIMDKGGHIFRQIAESMPEREFAVVPGWHSLRNKNGSWNKDVIKNSLVSQNVEDLNWMPEDIEFSTLSNVEVLEPRENVADIFALTRILLVPSQYGETLARVSVEAFANSIPVVGSKVGGLQDHIGKAGLLIKDFSNPAAWIAAIESLDDSKVYSDYSQRATKFIAEDFSNKKTVQQFKTLFQELIESNKVT